MAADIIARGMAGNAKKLLDEYKNNPDVADIVQNKAALDAYDTSKLSENDVVKVLDDESKNHMQTYYKWVNNDWDYIGGLGPYYNQNEINALLALKANNSYIKDGMLHNYKGTSSINLYSGLERVVIPCIVEDIYSPVPSDASYNSSIIYYIKASDFEIETDKEYITFEEAAGEPINAEHFEDYKDYLYTYTSNVTYVHPTTYDPDETYYRYSGGKYVPYPGTITPQIFDRVKNMLYIIVYTTITFPTKSGTVALTSDLSLNNYQDSNSVNFTLGSEKVTIPYVASTYTVPTGAYDSSITYYGHCSDFGYPSTEPYAPYNDIVVYVDDPEECPPLDATVYSELVAEHLLYVKNSGNEIVFPTKSGTVALTSDIISGVVEKTYSELKAMRDGGTLVAGTQYRITDYTCTTTTTNTSSAGHQFDIIVVADSTNKLNENARAVLHSGDTYFANSKLESWQLKYCIDNDTTRFEWADATNGKGVVYYMKDEFNNECYYDFKNIRFSVYINATNYTYTNIYTFSKQPSSAYEDASLYADPNYTSVCHDNIIKAYYAESNSDFSMKLKANIMWVGCYNNIIENNCYANMLQAGCYDNVIQNKCYQIYIENHSSSNNIGESSSYIKFGSDNHTNIIGSYASNLTLGNYNSYNKFNNQCVYIRLGNSMFYNNFGNNCSYITFGSSSTTINYCRRITFDDSVQFIYLISSDTTASSSNYLQNVNIHKGISGSSDSNRLTITVPDRNLAYSIDYYKDGSTEVYL